jgi:hypothetical protein
MFKDFYTLIKSINNKSELIFFCENLNLYKKVFEDKIKYLRNKQVKIQIVTFKTFLKENIKHNNVDYLNFNNIDILHAYLKKIKNKIIVSSTPTINKKISNNSNFFIYVQHTLLKLSNKFTKEYIYDFDILTVSSEDQKKECLNLLNLSEDKILKYKYHSHKFITKNLPSNVNNTEKPTILIASSFYGNHLLKLIEENFLKELIKKYKLIIRPHPELYKDKKFQEKLNDFKNKFPDTQLTISNDLSNEKIIISSDFLITDYSGIGITFSYYKLIPTIFVINRDKDNDLLYENYNKSTLDKIGIIINFDPKVILERIKTIQENLKFYKKSIKNFRDFQLLDFDKEASLENFILEKLKKI